MPNFFRDSSLGFKSRSNILNKFKNKETSSANTNLNQTDLSLNEGTDNFSFTEDETDNSITNTLMMITNNNSNPGLTYTHCDESQTTQQTSIDSTVSGKGKKMFFSSTPKNNKHDNKNHLLNSVDSKNIAKSRNKTNIQTMEEEDDFEITEVRKVEEENSKISLPGNNSERTTPSTFVINTNNKNQFSAKPMIPTRHTKETISLKKDDISNSSSNDVLLEAFTNTQRICSNLKQELMLKQNENSKMKIKLNTYENDINKINIKVEILKKNLTDLESKSQKIFSQKEIDNEKIQNLKKEYETAKRIVNGFRNDIISLKTQINLLQDNKREIEIESTKRAKEIEYLKRELDDCSGQLSEEKIRNGSFTHELETFKNEIVRQFKQLAELSWTDFLQKNSINNKEHYEKISLDIKDNSEKETKKILDGIESTEIHLFEKYVKNVKMQKKKTLNKT